MQQTLLARIIHGSHLFGLATESSDRDYISVVLPTAEQILLGETMFTTFEGSTGSDLRKNTHADIDDKQISLATFLRLCLSGTLDAIELLNAPREFHAVEPHPVFAELAANRHRLASRNVDKIVGFCRSQAITYSPRKERYQAARTAENTLIALGVTEESKGTAGELFERVVDACASEYVLVRTVPNGNGKDMAHLDICGKLVAETVNASHALEVARSAARRYGRRVHDAAATSSHDWKSLSHALRIAGEGIEYVRTGAVTLPVRNRQRLLDIKLGRVPLGEVTEEVDETVRLLEREAAASDLPAQPDTDFVRDFVVAVHGGRVVADFPLMEGSLPEVSGLMLSAAPAMLGCKGN